MTQPPYWTNGNYKWYIDKQYQDYLVKEQADNLPSLTKIGVFRVVNELESIDDYVLIDDNQNPIKSCPYSSTGAEQLEAFINILKISKHFDISEGNKFKRKTRKYEKS